MCYLCNYASECVQFPLRGGGGGGGIYVVVLGACGIYICVCVRACMRACVRVCKHVSSSSMYMLHHYCDLHPQLTSQILILYHRNCQWIQTFVNISWRLCMILQTI